MTELDSVYDPKRYERQWWDHWTREGHFKADASSTKPPYTILMPPPNVTDRLHMGHGLNDTIQDILIRWKRMRGYNACWLPGTDHAGIATQMMVEKALAKEGLTKKDLGREAFLQRLWDWKEKNGGIIIDQLKRLGCSADWDREAFTMSPSLSKAVRYIFVSLFNEGLIYQGHRLVNWDPALKTAISDDEVENETLNGKLWYFRYPVDGPGQEFITIATTRPETMLGDTAVAVHPDDERFKHLIGRQVKLPFTGRLIPIIADTYVKSEFGSGAVKITPAHDPNDFKIGQAHNLPSIDIMNDDGSIADTAPLPFRGMDRFLARKEIVKAMKAAELFDKEENNQHTVPHSSRSKAIIEPRLSRQWFVKMQPLAVPAVEAAKTGELKFFPDSWKKTYLHWLENIEDWCISRQLWWGHRIPIWHCKTCGKHTSTMEDPTQCSHCSATTIEQDPDVLDTWFSSWLWPLSPFGWPEKTKDLATFYPSNVLVTGPDIIFLWVARMVMVGQKTMGEIPFQHVYFNSIICDKQGRKFSKTLGNGIDPLEVIDKHGADAVRYTVISLASIGGRVRMSDTDFENGARFVNKIWNAARFLMRQIDRSKPIRPLVMEELDVPSRWLVSELSRTADVMNRSLESYRFNEAVETLHHFIWGSFCDWGLECAKEALTGDDAEAKAKTLSVLVYVLDGALRLASPVIPFVAEEIWQKLPAHPSWDRPKSLMVARYPDGKDIPRMDVDAAKWASVQSLISGVRSVRSQAGLAPKDEVEVHVRATQDLIDVFAASDVWIKRLTAAKDLHLGSSLPKPSQSLIHVDAGFEAFVPMAGLLDFDKEKKRLSGEIDRIQKIVAGLKSKLGNDAFTAKAPPEVIDGVRTQEKNMSEQLDNLQRNLKALQD